MPTQTPSTTHRYIGIDLGGTKIDGVILDHTYEPVVRRRLPTESARGYAHIVDRIVALATELRQDAPACATLGIGTPGSISRRDGTMKNCNTTCLNGRALREDLQQRLGMAIRLEND